MTAHPYTSEAEWHALRAQNVGASEVPALFDASPFLTRWQLWQIKSGNLPPANLDSDTAVLQGKHFEPAVATYAEAKFGLRLRKVRRYITDDECPGAGASLDYEEFGGGSLVPTEIKWSLQWGAWDWDGDMIVEAPEAYLLQCHHQIACTGAPRANLFAFVGGDLRRLTIERSEKVILAIRREVSLFWESVRQKQEPPPDYKNDAEAIASLAALRPVSLLDESPEVAALVRRQYKANRLRQRMEDVAAEAKARLVHMMMEAARNRNLDPQAKAVSLVGDYRITSSLVAPQEGNLVTEEMVGSRIGARNGYRLTRITMPKRKKGAQSGKDQAE